MRAPRRGDLELTAAVALATILTMVPIARLIQPAWMPGAILTVVGVLLAGWILRRVRVPVVLAGVGELLVWAGCSTLALGHEASIAGVVPTLGVLRDLPVVLAGVNVELIEGVAPLDPSRGLSFALVSAAGLLAFAIGHLVRAARLPLLAAAVLVAVFVAPQLVVPGDPDLVPAVLLAATLLWIARAEIRWRRPGMEAGPVASTWAAVLAGASVLAALIFAPGVPLSSPFGGGGVGATSTITATLDLGGDLRRPQDIEVLRVRNSAGTAPYLRVATLTSFDGNVWAPDDSGRDALEFEPVDSSVETEEQRTRIEVTRLQSQYLPVPFPAVEVTGAVGRWASSVANRTVSSASTTSLGQAYEVVTQVPQLSREQAQAAMPRDASGGYGDHPLPETPEVTAGARDVPSGAQGAVAQLASEVTADATNAYDALVALQSWFRGGDFRYSLDAPVEEGFDGSGMDAIERFLEVREGYCVHFASTFAVMARSLGIPTRVVVGYLPGRATGEEIDDETVYSVLASQLHSWPEAYLPGLGWMPFEPTVGLGSPTALRAEDAASTDPDDPARPSASPTPTTSAAAPEQDRGDVGGPETSSGGFDGMALLRGLGIVLLVLVLLALPAVVRAARWALHLAAARRGEAGAAWRELQDIAIDAGLTVDESESPRAFAERLMARGVPAEALGPLVDGIERASFAPPGGEAPDVSRPLTRVRRALLPVGRERLRATLLPRSLVVRPSVRLGRRPAGS